MYLVSYSSYDRTDYGVIEMLRKMRNLLALRVQSVRMYGSCAMNMCYGEYMMGMHDHVL